MLTTPRTNRSTISPADMASVHAGPHYATTKYSGLIVGKELILLHEGSIIAGHVYCTVYGQSFWCFSLLQGA